MHLGLPVTRLVRCLTVGLVAWSTGPAFGLTAALTSDPNPPAEGANTLTILVKDDTGKPLDGAKIKASASMVSMGSMPQMNATGEVRAKGSGRYEATLELAMGGTWTLELSITAAGQTEDLRYSITTGLPGIASRNGDGLNVTGGDGQTLVNLGPGRLQLIGVRFVTAKRLRLQREIRAVGIVEQDQSRRDEVTLRYSGYVVKQFKGQIGDHVAAGEPLFSVYSPDLVTAQSEFLLAGKQAAEGGHALGHAAEERLHNLGMSSAEITQIRTTAKTQRDLIIRAPRAGTVLEVTVREGGSIGAGQVAYVIGDLSKSFVVARVFQQDIGDLVAGQAATLAVPNSPGPALTGRINLIFPQVEPGAGTTNIRIETAGPTPLRPGTYVDTRLAVDLGERLSIPVEAVLYSGLHRYVFVDRGQGALEPREIITGKTAGDLVEVVSGLKDGERITASGSFLLGSEAQLRSALPKWQGGQP